MTVEATSTSAGTATLENSTTGKSVTHTFASSATEADLCEYDAEWIVEDFEEGLSLVPFADFGTVEFTSAYATKSTGTTVNAGASGGTVIDIRQSGTVYTSCSATGETVTCSYTG